MNFFVRLQIVCPVLSSWGHTSTYALAHTRFRSPQPRNVYYVRKQHRFDPRKIPCLGYDDNVYVGGTLLRRSSPSDPPVDLYLSVLHFRATVRDGLRRWLAVARTAGNIGRPTAPRLLRRSKLEGGAVRPASPAAALVPIPATGRTTR